MSSFRLDIGCGLILKTPLDEWTHLDIHEGPHIELVTDFGHIPLDDGSVAEIWAGDVIEHIPPWRMTEVLAEWRRVLAPNGWLKGKTPNLWKTVNDYANGLLTLNDAKVPRLYGWADRLEEQHYATYTEESLTALFVEHGFGQPDFSASPGPVALRWWLVFAGRKL